MRANTSISRTHDALNMTEKEQKQFEALQNLFFSTSWDYHFGKNQLVQCKWFTGDRSRDKQLLKLIIVHLYKQHRLRVS